MNIGIQNINANSSNPMYDDEENLKSVNNRTVNSIIKMLGMA